MKLDHARFVDHAMDPATGAVLSQANVWQRAFSDRDDACLPKLAVLGERVVAYASRRSLMVFEAA